VTLAGIETVTAPTEADATAGSAETLILPPTEIVTADAVAAAEAAGRLIPIDGPTPAATPDPLA